MIKWGMQICQNTLYLVRKMFYHLSEINEVIYQSILLFTSLLDMEADVPSLSDMPVPGLAVLGVCALLFMFLLTGAPLDAYSCRN